MVIVLVHAANSISSAPVMIQAVVKSSSSATLSSGSAQAVSGTVTPVNASNLAAIDNSADDLIQLKRKLELEKAQAEIKKFRSGGINNSSNSAIVQDNAQTTVTGVAINQDGRKIAWLQFADGGSLTVNIGSQVGKYLVSDIAMTGVRLSFGKGTKLESVFLKRAYYAPEKAKNQSNNNKSYFSPSPIVTRSNTGDDSEMVPPIVPIR